MFDRFELVEIQNWIKNGLVRSLNKAKIEQLRLWLPCPRSTEVHQELMALSKVFKVFFFRCLIISCGTELHETCSIKGENYPPLYHVFPSQPLISVQWIEPLLTQTVACVDALSSRQKHMWLKISTKIIFDLSQLQSSDKTTTITTTDDENCHHLFHHDNISRGFWPLPEVGQVIIFPVHMRRHFFFMFSSFFFLRMLQSFQVENTNLICYEFD